jgi:transposase
MKTKQSSAVMEPASKLINTVDFSNRNLYVGIDVHKVKWQVAVYHDGLILSNVSMNASLEGLIAYLHKHYGNAPFHCVYESGPFGFTLCRGLWAAGIDCIVVNPADIPGTDKEKRRKTDVIDARKLARHHASGYLPPYMYLLKNSKNKEVLFVSEKNFGAILFAQRTV